MLAFGAKSALSTKIVFFIHFNLHQTNCWVHVLCSWRHAFTSIAIKLTCQVLPTRLTMILPDNVMFWTMHVIIHSLCFIFSTRDSCSACTCVLQAQYKCLRWSWSWCVLLQIITSHNGHMFHTTFTCYQMVWTGARGEHVNISSSCAEVSIQLRNISFPFDNTCNSWTTVQHL